MEALHVKIHPASQKAILKGHPWVTVDGFSKRFPKEASFLTAALPDGRSALLLNDPLHPRIKARLWDFSKGLPVQGFMPELRSRLLAAFNKRVQSAYITERDNYYLAFGEGDRLAGLFILRLKNVLLIQIYCGFWEQYLEPLLNLTSDVVHLCFKDWKAGTCLVQKRTQDQSAPYQQVHFPCFSKSVSHEAFTLNEFGIRYHVFLKTRYDVGLYTDMSAFRKRLAPIFHNGAKVLNLFSYTGAFSLFAITRGCRATSVDMSKKYLSILEDNLQLNENLDPSHHQSICMDVEKALQMLRKRGEKFNIIICDPPSYSSDGGKSAAAVSRYPLWLNAMADLSEKKGHLVLFLNTHQITMAKFKDTITRNLAEGFKIVQEMGLGEDCPVSPEFPEGKYLKCLVVRRY
jgi:23S rRNA (cytosine1962-C5)-methyltransferase